MKSLFIDEADIVVESGSGGGGSVHFRRARFLPKGGPDGGDGGHGGDVIFVARENLRDLSFYLHKRFFKAESGAPGGANKQHGKSGADLKLAVPLGTQVYAAETMELLADLDIAGAEVTVALGGKGGKGNVHYKSAVRQAPRIAQKGMPGRRLRVRLIYKMRTDVGLIGFPNVGKSKLLSRVSSARPKVAAYPFTTVVPQLGVFQPSPPRPPMTFVEIPGLAVGRENRFLRHVERAKVLLFLLEYDEKKKLEDFRDEVVRLRNIVSGHGKDLQEKERIVVLNKVDLAHDRGHIESLCDGLEKKVGERVVSLSAETGEGVAELLKLIERSSRLGL